MKIDRLKSIASGRLAYDKPFLYWLNMGFYLFIAGIFLIEISLTLLVADIQNENDKAFALLMLLVGAFILYSAYRKITQNKLLKIHLKVDEETAKVLIRQYFKKLGDEITRDSNHVMVVRRESDIPLSSKYNYKEFILLFDKKNIYLCVFSYLHGGTAATHFAHLFLKKTLRKIVNPSN